MYQVENDKKRSIAVTEPHEMLEKNGKRYRFFPPKYVFIPVLVFPKMHSQ